MQELSPSGSCSTEMIMLSNFTNHAAIRLQQRGIPPVVSDLLIAYGDEKFDGHGGVVRYFSTTGIQELTSDLGADSTKLMDKYRSCYLVQANDDGAVITVAKRHAKKHIWRN